VLCLASDDAKRARCKCNRETSDCSSSSADARCGLLVSVMFITENNMSNEFPCKPLPGKPAPLSRAAVPRFGKIRIATQYSGLGRSKLYELAAEHRGLFRKSGVTTLVDFQILDEILNSLPLAEIKPGHREKFGTRDGFGGSDGSNARLDQQMKLMSEETHLGSPRPSEKSINPGTKKEPTAGKRAEGK
jgi:hypothetical protein